jgi:tRNA pseudouridine55 synthase
MTDAAQSSGLTARAPRLPRRDVHGVLLLDKPLGLSSNDALVRAKRLLRANKAGHTGTLDPLATGLLPLCFGEATKFSQDLLDADKEYIATLRLGAQTTTGDIEGEVIGTWPVDCSVEEINAAIHSFLGPIEQVPPMYSALKKDGKPLYEYARAGETVERAPRNVVIREIEVLTCDVPNVSMRVLCSKGTYIRTLAEDIGKRLGCGAHLTSLRRTRVGSLTLEQAVSLEHLDACADEGRASLLAPVDRLLVTLPSLHLPSEQARRFCHGQRLALRDVPMSGSPIGEGALARIYCDPEGTLIGVGRVQAGALRPERLIRL